MRKLSLLMAFLFVAFVAQAQDSDSMSSDSTDTVTTSNYDENSSSHYNDYNHWSIELQYGVTKPTRPMAKGYYTETPSFWQGDIGVRYMINNLFGLKLDFGLNNFEAADGSKDFNSKIYRTSLQGVVNAGSLLGWREWTNTFNFLVHAGVGYGVFSSDDPANIDSDDLGFFTAGITPQIRLGDHFALTGDFSAYANFRQATSFDGTRPAANRGFKSLYFNGSIGLTYYIGSKEKHADWFHSNYADKRLEKLAGDIAGIRSDMQDSDHDGVANYLDQEPNTVSGVTVNTKGEAVDKNNNGIPDELEAALDQRYASEGGSGNAIKELLNKGYVNVYFKFDSTEPEAYSMQAINYIVNYMNRNTSANAELIGYADVIGNSEYNQELSLNRAKRVKDILVAAGVDASRLTVTGNGEDDSVDKSSSQARQMVRRVTVKLN